MRELFRRSYGAPTQKLSVYLENVSETFICRLLLERRGLHIQTFIIFKSNHVDPCKLSVSANAKRYFYLVNRSQLISRGEERELYLKITGINGRASETTIGDVKFSGWEAHSQEPSEKYSNEFRKLERTGEIRNRRLAPVSGVSGYWVECNPTSRDEVVIQFFLQVVQFLLPVCRCGWYKFDENIKSNQKHSPETRRLPSAEYIYLFD